MEVGMHRTVGIILLISCGFLVTGVTEVAAATCTECQRDATDRRSTCLNGCKILGLGTPARAACELECHRGYNTALTACCADNNDCASGTCPGDGGGGGC